MNTFRKHSLTEYIALYFRFMKLIMMSRMMYKWDTFLLSFSVLIRESVTVVTLYLILTRFSEIQGWDMGTLLFMYSFVFLTYSLCIFLFTGVRDFEGAVHGGEFDGYLTKPIKPLFHVMAKKSDIMAAIGHGGLGILLFLYSFYKLGLDWSVKTAMYVLLLLFGGVLIQGALLLLCAAFTFWTTKSSEIQNIMFYQTRSFIVYPISIYPAFIKIILTFIVPLAFVNYYPVQYLVKHEMVWLYMTPVVGIIAFGFAYIVWRMGLLRYKSTGH
ncbi:ABC transporter permease [Candidatus Pristimantibacillus sp. PTI5]|uniref:ABC transporter permease n=1 Tax=Candidatus Pristimantibacillus sp. PTI5 TaxID=3400422 RepID=UPI003B02A3C0